MVMVSLLLALCVGLPESVTVTMTVDDPADVGVPLTVQPLSINPALAAFQRSSRYMARFRRKQ